MNSTVIQDVKFDERGLIPAIVQTAATNEVIGLYYMDNDSLLNTLRTGQTYFCQGTSTIHLPEHLRLVDVRVSQDGGSLTVLVEKGEGTQKGHSLSGSGESQAKRIPHASLGYEVSLIDVGSMNFGILINDLYALIAERKEERPEGSYTTYLFNSGVDKILKKVAEESGEVIIAAKNNSAGEIISELADLFYHLLVLMVERNVRLGDLQAELARRATKSPARKDSSSKSSDKE
ncbi:MAG TPA: phosphoribosyl-ATP diphosphatase [Blastocatellia bacterium]|nr:phosphoribosyl-ATP diphosphatase [Blastocatellia bacterium]